MLKKYLSRFFCGACALVALSSCGDAKSGGTGEFATVFATASAPPSALDSDVAQWFDSATLTTKVAACSANGAPTVAPDDAAYTLTSTAYATPNTGTSNPTVPSDLLIDKITMTFTPANTLTPALPAAFQTQFPSPGQRIAVGSNSIPVRVVSVDLKHYFLNSGAQSLNCSNQGTSYSYRVTVSFHAVEVSTNREGTITPAGSLIVNVSDFIDK
jgi:hypothetical protein